MCGYTVEQISFLSAGRISTIRGVIYIPETTPVGILQISHGMCEYMGRYDRFMADLAGKGWIVAGNDHLGHGESSDESQYGFFGERDGYRDLVEDLHQMTVLLKRKFGPLPYVLLGHSMGSFAARLYFQKFGKELDGLILSGTGGPNPMSGLGAGIADIVCRRKGSHYRSSMLDRLVFGSYNRKCSPGRTEKDWLTRDHKIVDQYLQDPKCMFLFTAAAFRDLLTMTTLVNKRAWFQNIRKDCPVLLISGDMDPVGDYGRGVRKVCSEMKKAGIRDVTMELYHDARHEILNEINYLQVYQDVENWLSGILIKKTE